PAAPPAPRLAEAARPDVAAPQPEIAEPYAAPPLGPRPYAHGKRFVAAGAPWIARGVSYGPFRPASDGAPFPETDVAMRDFAAVAEMGANLLRVYHVPPPRIVDAAAASGLRILIGIPWPQHVAFLDSRTSQAAIRQAVARGVRRFRGHPGIFGWAIGNEVPPATVRWYGRRRIERFLDGLVRTAHDADPDGLVTYANFPTTEYLDPSEVDFLTLNVYLHDDDAFRRYLARLLNVAGERPLLIGELGFDSVREGERSQARRLSRQLRLALDAGAAGAVAYAWTDEWYTGGAEITDWSFGLVARDRRPKAAYRAVQQVFRWPAPAAGQASPRISVVICAYNAGSTIEACLASLRALHYPDFEVIVVNDGSTDETGPVADAVAAADWRFRVIHQPNMGLSAARNVGLEAATGEIVAYTDADCIADPDWLSHLARAFARTGAAAVGGLNIPEVGGSRVAACIAAAPGWPTHVLVDDDVAEHIPGCNMAFRRDVLRAIGGFDVTYRAAGDDVDVCWKLLDRGNVIRFTSAAFVWHVARRSVRAYLRQQRGYGRAEGMLFPRHTHRFNGWRNPRWAGVIYHRGSPRLTWGREWVYHGPFGTAPYQLLYGGPPGGAGHVVGTVEWQAASLLLVALGAVASGPLLALGLAGLALAAGRAVRFAWRATLPRSADGWASRALVAWLAYAQPLVRGWASYREIAAAIDRAERALRGGGPTGESAAAGFRRRWAFWSESGLERTSLLEACLADLARHEIPATLPGPSDRRDLVVFWGPWVTASVRTLEELHGGPKRLHRVEVTARPSSLGLATLALLALAALAGAVEGSVAGWALPLSLLAAGGTALASRAEQAARGLGRLAGATGRRLGSMPVPWTG
ncbi:MAG TPA: glycosyltransferase, partial [Thermodesulfobacteriota bacterium]